MKKTPARSAVERLAARVESLPFSQRLRIAADLWDKAPSQSHRDLAIVLAENAVIHQQAAKLFGEEM